MNTRIFFVVFVLFVVNRSVAQSNSVATIKEDPIQDFNVALVNPNGTPFLLNKYSTVTSGSAFYKDEFLPATIYFSDQKAAKAKLRLDLLDNSLHYLNQNNEEMVIIQEVQKIILEDPAGKELFVPGSTLPTENEKFKKSWFKVDHFNDFTIYILYSKTLFEYKPFNSGVVEKTIDTRERYFILKEGKLVESKKSRLKN